jgi:long-chain acyl-CoA synthetase
MRVGEPLTDTGAEHDLSWPIRRSAELFGGHAAVADTSLRLDYQQFARRVAALGGALGELQLAEGARIGFLGFNSVPHAECWFAVPGAGRVFVDLNFRLATAELEFIANDCGIELLIVDAERLEVGQELRRRCKALSELVLVGGAGAGDGALDYDELLRASPAGAAPRGQHDLAGICYTGGTTGRPKGVMLSHGNLMSNAIHNLIATGHGPDQRWLHVPPMFHVAGTANLFACTWAGCQQVIMSRFEARAFIEAVREHSITHVALVPTMLNMLMDELDHESSGEGLPSLRHIQYAASPITPVLQRRVLDYFDCDIVQLYGMTEAAPTVTRLSGEAHRRGVGGEDPHRRRLGSVGTPVVGVEVAVMDMQGQPVTAGEVGELCVRGPNVMLGYWNRDDATAAALADGWYHSGDAVWRDEEGYLFLVDRLKDMIITGGENVYSIEVEAALADHAGVSEVAVIGIPDPRWGEAVHAVVSLTPGAEVSEAALIEHCREHIAGYKVPRSIELRDEPLPKSGPGKILKSVLREPYWQDRDRSVN